LGWVWGAHNIIINKLANIDLTKKSYLNLSTVHNFLRYPVHK